MESGIALFDFSNSSLNADSPARTLKDPLFSSILLEIVMKSWSVDKEIKEITAKITKQEQLLKITVLVKDINYQDCHIELVMVLVWKVTNGPIL